MPKQRGRPKGVGNRKQHNANEQLGIVIAALCLRAPDLSVGNAARKVAPRAPDFDGDDSHNGKVPRRLRRFYNANAPRLKQLAHKLLTPPPPPPPTVAELANLFEEHERRAMEALPKLQERERILLDDLRHLAVTHAREIGLELPPELRESPASPQISRLLRECPQEPDEFTRRVLWDLLKKTLANSRCYNIWSQKAEYLVTEGRIFGHKK